MEPQSSEMDRVSTVQLDDILESENALLTNQGKTPSTGSLSKKATVKRKQTCRLGKLLKDLPDRVKLEKIRKSLKTIDFVSAILAVVTIWIIQYSSDKFYDNNNESTDEITAFRCLNAVLSIVMGVFIVKHHKRQFQIKIEMKTVNKNDVFWQSDQILYCTFECVTMCCFTPPYLDYEFEGEMLDGTYSYSADSIISCFAFVRLLLVFKLYPHINKWTRRDVHELSIQDQYKAMSNEFTAKFELRYSPLIILAVLVIILVAYVGYTFRVLERSYSSTSKSSLNLEEIYNCQWLSFTSLSTVGYGDAYPSTHLGRLLAAFTGIFGIFFTALVIGVAISFSELTEKQLKAFYIQKRSDRMVPVKESAADVIKTAFRLKRDRLRRPKLAAFITHHYDSIYTPKLKKFNNIYRFFRHSFIPAAMALDMMQSKMKLNSIQLREGFENFEKTTDYKEKLEKLTQHRDRQQEKLREIKQDLDTIEVEFLTIVNYIGAGESLT